MTIQETFTLENPVFSKFLFYATLVLLKTLLMSFVTALYRFKNKSFANPEDTASHKRRTGRELKPVLNDQEVERVRRCHLNDLENVFPFILVGLLYIATGPEVSTAVLHFRLFAFSRISHMFAYLIPLPQPSRALTFFIGWLTTISMAVRTLMLLSY